MASRITSLRDGNDKEAYFKHYKASSSVYYWTNLLDRSLSEDPKTGVNPRLWEPTIEDGVRRIREAYSNYQTHPFIWDKDDLCIQAIRQLRDRISEKNKEISWKREFLCIPYTSPTKKSVKEVIGILDLFNELWNRRNPAHPHVECPSLTDRGS